MVWHIYIFEREQGYFTNSDKVMKATEAAFSPATDGDGFPGTEGRILLTIALLGSLDLIALSCNKNTG